MNSTPPNVIRDSHRKGYTTAAPTDKQRTERDVIAHWIPLRIEDMAPSSVAETIQIRENMVLARGQDIGGEYVVGVDHMAQGLIE